MSDIAVKVSEPIALKARLNEDWLALVIGLLVFALALFSLSGSDLLGWAVNTSVYTDVTTALAPVPKPMAGSAAAARLLATYVALLMMLSAPRAALRRRPQEIRVCLHRSVLDRLRSWIVGNYANFAAVTPAELQKFGIGWSLKLTNEGGYIFALIAGLDHRQRVPALRRQHQGSGAARTLHQDRDRHPRRAYSR